jgi:putative sterol carrier protein
VLECAVTKWLTAEWFEETLAMAAKEPVPPGLSAQIQCQITGGADGEVTCHRVYDDGHLVSRGLGAVKGSDVTLSVAWADAVAMQRGDLDPNVAFMRGTMKVAGSMGVMLALLSVARTAEDQDLRRRMAEITEF